NRARYQQESRNEYAAHNQLRPTPGVRKSAPPGDNRNRFSDFNPPFYRLIDIFEKRFGYRHTIAMQWRGQVIAFETMTVGAGHFPSHVTVNQHVLDGPHLVELAAIGQKFLF